MGSLGNGSTTWRTIRGNTSASIIWIFGVGSREEALWSMGYERHSVRVAVNSRKKRGTNLDYQCRIRATLTDIRGRGNAMNAL